MPIVASVSMSDSFQRRTTKRLETETEVLATAQSAVSQFLSELNPCTDLAVDYVTYSFKDATQTIAGAASSNVDVGATFRGRVTSGEIAVVKIPGFPLAKVGANGYIDLADADVATLLGEWEAAGAFTLSDGEVIVEWIDGQLDK